MAVNGHMVICKREGNASIGTKAVSIGIEGFLECLGINALVERL